MRGHHADEAAQAAEEHSRGWSEAASAASGTHGKHGIYENQALKGRQKPFHLTPLTGLTMNIAWPPWVPHIPWVPLAPAALRSTHGYVLSPLTGLEIIISLPTVGSARHFMARSTHGYALPRLRR